MVHCLVRSQTRPMKVVCFGASRNFERAKRRNDWLWTEKSPYFTLSFSFQINISVKIRTRLLKNLCGTLVEKFVSDQSSGLKEIFRRWMKWRKWMNFPALSCSRSFSRQFSARLSAVKVWYVIENRAYASMCKHVQQSFSGSASRGQRMGAFIRTLSRLS